MNNLNDIIGDKLSIALSSMYMFWLIFIVTMIPAFITPPSTITAWVQYLSSSVFQAAALPLINYTTNKGTKVQEKISLETHDAVMQELKIAKQERRELRRIIKELNDRIEQKDNTVI